MTRKEAQETIYRVVNSGILDLDLESDLKEIASAICYNNFESCENENCCEKEYGTCKGCK